MKKEMIGKVVAAMERTGLVEVELYGAATKEERLEEMSEIIAEEVRKIEEEEKRNLLKAILKDFNDFVDQANVIDGEKVTVNPSKDDEYSYDMTYKDALDFVRSEWDNVAIRLCEEFGIDLDEYDTPVQERFDEIVSMIDDQLINTELTKKDVAIKQIVEFGTLIIENAYSLQTVQEYWKEILNDFREAGIN